MDRYFDRFLAMAETVETGFILDTNTWRSGTHWAKGVGRSPAQMQDLTREAVRFAMAIRDRWQDRVSPILLNGVIGPAGDAYDGTLALDAATAEAIHAPQIALLANCGVDLVSALTFGSLPEAIGLARASVEVGRSGCDLLHGGDRWTLAGRNAARRGPCSRRMRPPRKRRSIT